MNSAVDKEHFEQTLAEVGALRSMIDSLSVMAHSTKKKVNELTPKVSDVTELSEKTHALAKNARKIAISAKKDLANHVKEIQQLRAQCRNIEEIVCSLQKSVDVQNSQRDCFMSKLTDIQQDINNIKKSVSPMVEANENLKGFAAVIEWAGDKVKKVGIPLMLFAVLTISIAENIGITLK